MINLYCVKINVPAPQVNQTYMQIELKCSESAPNRACCDDKSYVCLWLFESPNSKRLEETGVNKAEMNCYSS